ncbi:AMP-binding protein [Actinosynnema sp. NPDC047251]|uniref:Amide synthetase n=1 Tax=Saccharothrix espanaensis (strain ATCC 51144 / DSM 44229 / JCM 9112 / NBRC 15066 / NRRL 15764) TaxID=1179773 RepID=K0K6T1_SACES|nr:AMP-binding protein [Saccharothrix espanaensis]CCH32293.1 Amide synthetase [Saccharothrix espanaensis DSM 44229]
MSGNYVGDLVEVFARDPARTVLWWQENAISAGELVAAIGRAAHGMRARVRGPAVVGLLTTTNTPDTVVLRYAANLIGVTVVHLQTANAVDPLDRIDVGALQDTARLDLLAVDADHLAAARALCGKPAEPPGLVALGKLGDDVLDLSAGPDRFELSAGPDGWPVAEDVDPEQPATVTYTSGTTGTPKGVAMSFGVRRMVLSGLPADLDTVYLSTLPLSHSSGAIVDLVLGAGGSVVLEPGFDPTAALAAVARHGVTRMAVSPPQLYALLEHPDVRTTDLTSLRTLTYAGCPAAPARLAEAVRVFGDVLVQAYGTSEVGPITELAPADHRDAGLLATAGRPVIGEVEVRDPLSARRLPIGEVGEVRVRSPLVMLGYWHDPELTASAFDSDGWLRTGDLGRFDERGYLTLSGRMSDVIKTRGVRVHPVAVENALLAHPDVRQAAVFRVTDENRVERTCAVVVPRAGSGVTPTELIRHVGEALSPSHAPADVRFRAELPLDKAGKPDRKVLR